MSQKINLNSYPYFDDFNESKNYKRVLFKPGTSIQARELTTLQSILQNQVDYGHNRNEALLHRARMARPENQPIKRLPQWPKSGVVPQKVHR